MKRTALLRRRVPMGAAARRRIRAGGPTSVHRAALSIAGYRVFSRMKFESQAWRCGWCVRVTPLELEHAIPRSHGGADAWATTWGCCRGCAVLKERPFADGRLLTLPLGGGLIDLLYVIGAKHDYTILERKVIGRPPTEEERMQLEALA